MSYSILDIVSEDLAKKVNLTPPTGPVEFKLYRAGKVDNNSTKKITSPQAHILAGMDTIQDPFDNKNRTKLIRNITGYNPVQNSINDTLKMEPIVDYVRFGHTGRIILFPEQVEQIYFCRLMNKNGGNPNRMTKYPDGRTIAKIFYEVDEKKEISIKNNVFEYKIFAGNILVNASDDDMVDIAVRLMRQQPKKYTFDIKDEPWKLKASVMATADRDPVDFIIDLGDERSEAYARIIVDDAAARRDIFFDDHEQNLTWKWVRSKGQKGKVSITKVEPGTKPAVELVKFLLTPQGNEHYMELKELHKQYYQSR